MTPKVYVGTSPGNERAERVLEYSIRKYASGPVDVHFMRAGEGIFEGWNDDVATPFTFFRYAVPHLTGGFAIYLDVDMLLLDDIYRLWDYRSANMWQCAHRTDVSVIDCDSAKVPSIEALREMSRRHKTAVTQAVHPLDTIPWRWNCDDNVRQSDIALLHFTTIVSQPWQPWPDRVAYQSHVFPEYPAMWHQHEKELLSARQGE
jgi:hypothetical protein